jgi:hypothetical protein
MSRDFEDQWVVELNIVLDELMVMVMVAELQFLE